MRSEISGEVALGCDIISKGAAQKMSTDSTFTNLAVNPQLNFF